MDHVKKSGSRKRFAFVKRQRTRTMQIKHNLSRKSFVNVYCAVPRQLWTGLMNSPRLSNFNVYS